MRLDPGIVAELQQAGVRWRLEPGGKHLKLFVNDRFVGIWPHGKGARETDRRPTLNLRAQVRRVLRETRP